MIEFFVGCGIGMFAMWAVMRDSRLQPWCDKLECRCARAAAYEAERRLEAERLGRPYIPQPRNLSGEQFVPIDYTPRLPYPMPSQPPASQWFSEVALDHWRSYGVDVDAPSDQWVAELARPEKRGVRWWLGAIFGVPIDSTGPR